MWNRIGRWIAPALMSVGSLGGLTFAWISTLDYSRHLDRQVHDLRCGFVPGLVASPGADEGCRAAIYSPYAALFRDKLWGGVPIAIFAVGAFAFFLGLSLYLLLAGRNASRRAIQTTHLLTITPFAVSILMAIISATQLGTFCKTCMGIYFSSTLLFAGGQLARMALSRETSDGAPDTSGVLAARALGEHTFAAIAVGLIAVSSVLPAYAYSQSVPNHDEKIGSCGKLEKPLSEKSELAIKMPPTGNVATPRKPVLMMVDPLCPSCRALHRRLDSEGFLEQMDASLLLFPLDSSCNWNVDRDVHPGACQVAKAMLCAQPKGDAIKVLEWAYEQQETLLAAAKTQGAKAIDGFIEGQFPGLASCMKDKATARRLDDMVRFAVDNHLPVSTPQIFLGNQRMCDEDTDMGLVYSLRKLVPEFKF